MDSNTKHSNMWDMGPAKSIYLLALSDSKGAHTSQRSDATLTGLLLKAARRESKLKAVPDTGGTVSVKEGV